MAQKGSGKGQGWERDLSRRLSLWVSNGKSKNVFWRSRASGAFSTNRMKAGKAALRGQVGDISLLDQESEEGKWFLSRFAIEAKFERPKNMWPGAEGWLRYEKYWHKITKEATSAKVLPWLILKTNFQPPLLLVSSRVFRSIWLHLVNENPRASNKYAAQRRYTVHLNEPAGIEIVFLEDFLQRCPFKLFREAIDGCSGKSGESR